MRGKTDPVYDRSFLKTKGMFIKNMKPAEVVNAVMLHWVVVGFGRLNSLQSDVGGELMQKLLK